MLSSTPVRISVPVPAPRVLWTAKPGSGCTTAAVAVAAAAAEPPSDGVLLVDLAGDLATAVGLAEPRHGVTDWLAADTAGHEALTRLERPVSGSRVHLLPFGSTASWSPERATTLCDLLAADRRTVVVDAGTVTERPGPLDDLRRLLATTSGSVLVTRSCYLALRRARLCPVRPQAVLLVREDRRIYDRHEVADAVGAPVVAQIDLDPSIARRVDAGQLLHRCPRRLRLQARRVLR